MSALDVRTTTSPGAGEGSGADGSKRGEESNTSARTRYLGPGSGNLSGVPAGSLGGCVTNGRYSYHDLSR